MNEEENIIPLTEGSSQQSKDENISDSNIQHTTLNIQHNKENMEVHKHPHHVTHKKKWGEYLLEFFMLFLAVFLGFVAENIREHQVEKNREHEFVKSLTTDLKDDSHNLEDVIAFERVSIKLLDTLITLLNDPKMAKQNGDELYYAARLGPREQPFAINSRTFDQLKNSGGFLLIKNVEASNQIITYYNQFSPVRLLEENYNSEFDNYKRVAARIFDPAILRRQETASGDILLSNDNPLLMSYDGMQLKELAYHVVQMSGSRRTRLVMLQGQKDRADKLRADLQKEYHLD